MTSLQKLNLIAEIREWMGKANGYSLFPKDDRATHEVVNLVQNLLDKIPTTKLIQYNETTK